MRVVFGVASVVERTDALIDVMTRSRDLYAPSY
jgi:hypothetical protein